MSNPVWGCPTCAGSAGRMACPTHRTIAADTSIPPTRRLEFIAYVCSRCNRIRSYNTLPPPGVTINEFCACLRV
jgi:hypothetical protein